MSDEILNEVLVKEMPFMFGKDYNGYFLKIPMCEIKEEKIENPYQYISPSTIIEYMPIYKYYIKYENGIELVINCDIRLYPSYYHMKGFSKKEFEKFIETGKLYFNDLNEKTLECMLFVNTNSFMFLKQKIPQNHYGYMFYIHNNDTTFRY